MTWTKAVEDGARPYRTHFALAAMVLMSAIACGSSEKNSGQSTTGGNTGQVSGTTADTTTQSGAGGSTNTSDASGSNSTVTTGDGGSSGASTSAGMETSSSGVGTSTGDDANSTGGDANSTSSIDTGGSAGSGTTGDGAGGSSGGAAGSGGVASGGGGGTTGGDNPYGLCDNAGQCDIPGSSCITGLCAPPCTRDDCPAPIDGTAEPVCNFSLCYLECGADMTCPSGLECQDVCRWPDF